MSASQNPTKLRHLVFSTTLNRLFLFCRFNFSKISGGFPALRFIMDMIHVFLAGSAAPAAAISRNVSIFFDPLLEDAKPLNRYRRNIQDQKPFRKT
jgi:hypothetical protein